MDSFKASAIWGRVGASILCIIALALGFFGYQMEATEQAAMVEAVGLILTGLAAILAFVSKIREFFRAKKDA